MVHLFILRHDNLLIVDDGRLAHRYTDARAVELVDEISIARTPYSNSGQFTWGYRSYLPAIAAALFCLSACTHVDNMISPQAWISRTANDIV